MDQNQPVDNDLQQAIDNINNPAASANVAATNPTAATTSDPAGGTALDEPIGPFPETAAKVGVVTPGPEPIAPFEPIAIPDLGAEGDAKVTTTPESTTPNPFTTNDTPAPGPEPLTPPTPTTPEPAADPITAPEPTAPSDSAPTEPLAPAEPEHQDAPALDNTSPEPAVPIDSDTESVKKAALDALKPLMKDHLRDVSPEKRFDLCRNIIEDLHDSSMYDEAYDAASQISNEDDRAKALLFIIESIDGQE